MRITDVTTTVLHTPDTLPFHDSTMRQVGTSWSGIFVHIKTDEGHEGLGVGVTPGTRDLIEQVFKPLLVGQDPLNHEKLWEELFWAVRGYGRKGMAFTALSAVDIGLWDLKGKIFDAPLYKLIGHYTDTVPIYGSGGWTHFTVDELVREQAGFVEQGIPRVKLKVGKDFGKAEREDVERLAAVRKALGDDVEIYIDANNGYYARQAIVMARRFEQYNVAWFEEPVLADDIAGLAEVARANVIPVATGEHEYTKYGFKDLIAAGGADIVQPDVCRVGGITEWLKVAHLAHAFNLPVAPHAIAPVHLHLACCTPNLRVVEVLGVEDDVYRRWFTELPAQKNGMWSPFPDKPGLGLELNPKAVEKWGG
jgi:L-alanine-DL-glutamate epimerase-like enolase superfamily enzyme